MKQNIIYNFVITQIKVDKFSCYFLNYILSYMPVNKIMLQFKEILVSNCIKILNAINKDNINSTEN